jgi:3-hydroxyacyl-CoA dehydrogenase
MKPRSPNGYAKWQSSPLKVFTTTAHTFATVAAIEDDFFDKFQTTHARKFKHQQAPAAIVQAARAAVRLPFDEAMALERKLFLELRAGEQSKALRYVFQAERAVAEVPGLDRTHRH